MKKLIEDYLLTLDDTRDTEEFNTARGIAGAVLDGFLKWYTAQQGVNADLLPCGHSYDNLGGDFVGNSFCVACRDGQ